MLSGLNRTRVRFSDFHLLPFYQRFVAVKLSFLSKRFGNIPCSLSNVTSSSSDNAFTTETPTPCKPPLTEYRFAPNLPHVISPTQFQTRLASFWVNLHRNATVIGHDDVPDFSTSAGLYSRDWLESHPLVQYFPNQWCKPS